jgi:hypothetical protein
MRVNSIHPFIHQKGELLCIYLNDLGKTKTANQ